MQINKVNDIEPYYVLYIEKNHELTKRGFPLLSFSDFVSFKNRCYAIQDKNTKIGFFIKENDGFCDSPRYIFSNFFLKKALDNEEALRLKKTFLDWVKTESVEEATIVVEDYLTTEIGLANNIFSKKDHYTIRLINNNIMRIYPGADNPGNEIKIRSFAIGKDENSFVDIFNDAFGGLCETITSGDMQQWISSPKFTPECYLFAEKKNVVIGFVAIEINMQEKIKHRLSYLQEIGVRKEFQGKGIGSLLLNSGLKAAVSCGSNRMGVGVLGRNQQALGFFRKKGFSEIYKKMYWSIS